MNATKRFKLKRTLLFTIPSVIIIMALIFSYAPQSKLLPSFATVSTAALHQNIIVSSGQDVSTLGIPLIKLSNYTTGMAPGRQMDQAGIPITVKDNSHVLLTLYDGNSGNGTILVATASNIGTEPVTLTGMNILGAVVNKQGTEFTNFLNAATIGCTGDHQFANNIVTVYANGTRISHVENQAVVCNNAAVHSVMTLEPGESVTAHVITPLNVGNEKISRTSVSASYNLGPGSYEYTMVMPYQPIK